MTTLQMRALSPKPTLNIREAADSLLSQCDADASFPGEPLAADFEGIVTLTPSYAEQLIRGIKARLPADAAAELQLRILNASPHMARTFTAIGRAHKMTLDELSPTEWVLRPADAPAP